MHLEFNESHNFMLQQDPRSNSYDSIAEAALNSIYAWVPQHHSTELLEEGLNNSAGYPIEYICNFGSNADQSAAS
jgi:hypothetical protein